MTTARTPTTSRSDARTAWRTWRLVAIVLLVVVVLAVSAAAILVLPRNDAIRFLLAMKEPAPADGALDPHEERDFEDGEHKARPLVSVRGRDVYVLHALGGGASAKMACARIVAVLVPSPTRSPVFSAAWRSIWAPRFSSGP